MGFFDKIKTFGSKIISGIRKGWDFVKEKVAPVVRKLLPIATTAASGIATGLGHPEAIPTISKISGVVDKGLRFISD